MSETADKMPEQLLLDWPVKEAFSNEDFLPSHSNKEAVRWIDEWPRWQRGGEDFHCLIIYGSEGCGKTHLCHVWQKISGAVDLAADKLSELDFAGSQQFVYIIEDVDEHINNTAVAEGLFHLYNWLKSQGGYLLLTGKTRPRKWPVELADLSSRLLSSEAVKILPPDDELLQSVLLKQFSDRQIILSDKVTGYIMRHSDRSFGFIRLLVREIDKLSMSEKRKITVPVVKRALDRLEGEQ